MDLVNRISEHFSESAHLKLQSMDVLAAPIAAAAERMVQCLRQDGKILACGNGGSAADAQHFSGEMLNRFERERPPLAGIALTALYAARTTGVGDRLDLSVQELHVAGIEAQMANALARGADSARLTGNNMYAQWGIQPCADGYIGVAAMPRHRPNWPLCRNT